MSKVVDYRTARRHLLKAHNAAHGTAHKTLAAAGLSLAKKIARHADPQAMTPKRQRAVKAAVKASIKKTPATTAKRSHHKAKS